jgi:ABC-type glycerol-3-phosphate transport system substrate-binding protein
MRLVALCAAAVAALPSLAWAQADWKAEFGKTVAAAEAEGELVMMSQPNEAARTYIGAHWAKAYPKIKLSISALDPPQYIQRLKTERGAGKYLWDVALAGYIPAYVLSHDGALDPILDEFVDPEIKNPALWGGWDEALTDRGHKYVFSMSNYIAGPWYDALHISPAKVEKLGLKIMLEPELKGKTVWHDPTVLGSGQGYAYLLYDKLGKDGLRKLVLDQKAQLPQQMFQVVDYMAHGTAWIGIGPPVRALIKRYEKAGIKTDVRAMGNQPDRNANVMGGSFLSVFNKRPHPNASRVFVNWLLSKETQLGLAQVLDQASRRKDLPVTTLPDETPIPGAHYFAPQREENIPKINEAAAYIAELKKEAK